MYLMIIIYHMGNHIHLLLEIVVLVFNHLVRACGHPGVRDREESKNWLIKSFQNHMLFWNNGSVSVDMAWNIYPGTY